MALAVGNGVENAPNQVPQTVADAVLKPSESLPADSKEVSGIDFNEHQGRNVTVDDLVSSMANMGFQASALGEAVRIINNMV
jgi:deoxyhypusine synthase